MKILILGGTTITDVIITLLKNISPNITPQTLSFELIALSGNFGKIQPEKQEVFVLRPEKNPVTFFVSPKHQAFYGKSRRRNVLRGSSRPSLKRSPVGKTGRRNGGR